MPTEHKIIVVTGVAGAGKTTVGQHLAARLGCPFYDADAFHSAANVARMARGEPLTDAQRRPWLRRLNRLLLELECAGKTAVLACSALKVNHRRRLSAGLSDIAFVYLHGDYDLIYGRLQQRSSHYMSAAMLQSQFQALEPPQPGEALHVHINAPVEQIVARILGSLPATLRPPSP